jgi:hypothetical protein
MECEPSCDGFETTDYSDGQSADEVIVAHFVFKPDREKIRSGLNVIFFNMAVMRFSRMVAEAFFKSGLNRFCKRTPPHDDSTANGH